MSMEAVLTSVETERLVLRPLTLDDAQGLHEAYQDPEVMRFITPVMTTKVMFASRDTDILGAPLRKGEMVAPLLLAANHDSARFDAPGSFRPDRRPNAHLGFGFGPHVCLGMHLARLEVRVLFEELSKRISHIEAAGEQKFLRSNFVGGLKELPVRIRRA